MPLSSATTNPKTIKAMKKRYNVILAGCQAHIKDRKYEDVSLRDVLYILEKNTDRDYLSANNLAMPSHEVLNEFQSMSSESSIYIEEYNHAVNCEFFGIDYPDYFNGFGYMKGGFCVPLFQQNYTGTQLSELIHDEVDSIDYGFSNDQFCAIYDMCAKLDTELRDTILIDLSTEAITSESVPYAYFIFND